MGGNVGGAWLTEDGHDTLEFLEGYGDAWDDWGPFYDDEDIFLSSHNYREFGEVP